MLLIRPYIRESAVAYARRWAFSQNPLFGNFRDIGGNCTNFVSQCLYAGSCRMNYLPIFGWYYISMDERAPAWTGVPYLYNFLVGNEGEGPFGREATPEELEIGDVIQLGREADGFYHTLLIVGFEGEDPLVAAQTDDALDRPLSTYTYDYMRAIKILGVRVRSPITSDCFTGVISGTQLAPTVSEPSTEGEPPMQDVPPMGSEPPMQDAPPMGSEPPMQDAPSMESEPPVQDEPTLPEDRQDLL